MTRQQQLEAHLRRIDEGVNMASRSASKINLLSGLSVSRDILPARRMREVAFKLREYADILDEKSEEIVS